MRFALKMITEKKSLAKTVGVKKNLKKDLFVIFMNQEYSGKIFLWQKRSVSSLEAFSTKILKLRQKIGF